MEMGKMRKALLMVMVVTLALSTIPQLLNVHAHETYLWGSSVYSSGLPVTSPVLKAGRQYRIVAREIFWYNYAADLAADAMYYTDSPPHWNWINFIPAPDGHSFLQINGMDVNWGPFSNGATGHTYSIYYTGTGVAITFKLVDWIDGYGNNNCHLPVVIYEQDLSPGYSPGFWKHNIGVALGYNSGNYSAFRDGTKLTAEMLTGYANTAGVTLEEAYEALNAQGPGMDIIRRNAANAFNAVAGFGPYIDEMRAREH